jgi:hypothetical protein
VSADYPNISASADKPIIRPSISALLSRDFSPCGTESAKIKLPVGIADQDGRIINEARLAPLDGQAEILIDNVGRNAGFIAWVTTLLNRTVRLEGNFTNGIAAERFSVADRDLMVCALRILTFGPELWGIVQCPHQDCESRLDLIFDLTTVKVPDGNKSREKHRATIERGSQKIDLYYREPNGSDQEALLRLLHNDPGKARYALISRCLIEAKGLPGTTAKTLAGLPEDIVHDIDKALSEGITSFDWDLDITCSECNRTFTSTLDIQAYFWEELQLTKDDFWKEVHWLAFYYHWSESEILALTRWRRKMYLNHIRRHLETANNA